MGAYPIIRIRILGTEIFFSGEMFLDMHDVILCPLTDYICFNCNWTVSTGPE